MRIFSTLSRTFRWLMPQGPPRIHCVGDSHTSFFSGQLEMQPRWPDRSHDLWPFFRSYRVGPALAFNLCRTGTRSKGRERLFKVLRRKVPAGERVLLCFGEIDCRAHLIRQSETRGVPVADLAAECVSRYFQVVREVRALNYQVMIWNVIPPTITTCLDCEYPVAGTFEERMSVTRVFNSLLLKHCEQESIPFISIFDAILDASGIPDQRYFVDGIHLGPEAIALAVDAMKTVCPEIEFAAFAKQRAA